LHDLFLIVAKEDQVSWRALRDFFRAIGHEMAED
jgi:hypothetical protein